MTGSDPRLVKLSRDNAALILVDHLTGFLPGLRSIPLAEYRRSVAALCRIGQIFKLPTILLGDEGGFRGSFFPEVRRYLPDAPNVLRHSPSAWKSEEFRERLAQLGRKKLILGGISLDNCVTQNALDLLANGYEVYVVVDASGTTDSLTELAAMLRLTQAGAVMTSWVSLASELLDDWETAEGPEVGRLYAELSPWGGEPSPASAGESR